ncbi:MAG: nucleotidyltransferase family protein [Bacteroidales bacterium]|nr:nucleotidyltransferase family protein [Bacteroidales bacterium]
MKAMIFAAGKGTRLKPLTDNLPKALVKVGEYTLLEHVIRHLKSFGIRDIIINIHYLGYQIIDFLNVKNNFDVNISISDESDCLLETGGGLKKAAYFFDDNKDFLVYNVDILSDIDIGKMLHKHQTEKNLATLAVRNRKSSRYFLFDECDKLIGWKNNNTGEKIIVNSIPLKPVEMAFSGIHIINPKIFTLIEEQGIFSITNVYLRLAENYPISSLDHSQSQWFDIGKHETLAEAENSFSYNY